MFPELLNFRFTLRDTYKIPAKFVGRPDLIANELFEDPGFYRPLCAYNNVLLSYGTRSGIDDVESAYRKELKQEGYSEAEIDKMVAEEMDDLDQSDDYWDGHRSSGYFTDLFEDRILLVPTKESCIEWLSIYKRV